MHVRAGRADVAVAGPRDHDEIHRAHHVFPAMPGSDFGEGVGADDEENLAALGLHALDGVDRITFLPAGPRGFEARRDEARLTGASQLDHAEAMLVIGAGFLV